MPIPGIPTLIVCRAASAQLACKLFSLQHSIKNVLRITLNLNSAPWQSTVLKGIIAISLPDSQTSSLLVQYTATDTPYPVASTPFTTGASLKHIAGVSTTSAQQLQLWSISNFTIFPFYTLIVQYQVHGSAHAHNCFLSC